MLERVKQLQPILPDYVINSNPGMTPENWYSEVFKAHQDLRGLSYEESKLEYVKLCSKIVNFGVIYFLIKGTKPAMFFYYRILVGKDYETSIDHWIGICSYGINLYSTEDKLNPKKSWTWTQVDDLNYK